MDQAYSVDFSRETGGFAIIGGCVGLVICLVIIIFVFLLWIKIFTKTGYPWAMSLLLLIPGLGLLIALCILAFSTWPIQKELEMLRQNQAGGMSGSQGTPPVTGDFRNV